MVDTVKPGLTDVDIDKVKAFADLGNGKRITGDLSDDMKRLLAKRPG